MISKNEETRIRLSGDWEHPIANRLVEAWFASLAMEVDLPDGIRYMHGMSGKKYRYLINHLVKNTPDSRYLEIGSWAGSTACSAIWKNKVKATCIDNWSEFGGPKDAFMSNIQYCLDNQLNPDDIDFNFIESDYRAVNYAEIGKHNIYLFDGPHETKDQADGISLVQPALDDEYVLIVDDWNAYNIQEGTIDAIMSSKNTIVAQIEVLTTTDGTHPAICREMSDWHNGYMIAVMSKNKG